MVCKSDHSNRMPRGLNGLILTFGIKILAKIKIWCSLYKEAALLRFPFL